MQFHKFLLILFNKIRQATRVTCSLCTCCGGPSTQAVVAAAISGDSSIVEMLLAANADVDARNAKRCCTFSLNGSGSFRSGLLYIIKRRAGQMTRLKISRLESYTSRVHGLGHIVLGCFVHFLRHDS